MPIRTCVGCRRTDEQASLLRIVCGPNGFALDPTRRASGRGAYLHRDRACIDRALRTRGVQRGLRLTAAPSTELAELLNTVGSDADV